MTSDARAMASTDSYVAAPPMKPPAWMNTQPGMPDASDSFSSLSPRHAAGMDLRFSKDPGPMDTHWMRHFFSRSSSYRQYRMGGCTPSSASRSYRCSFQGQKWVSLMIWPLGSTLWRASIASLTYERPGSHELNTYCTHSVNSCPVSATALRNCAYSTSSELSWFHAGFSRPTRAPSVVLFTYLGGSELSHWLTPLSTASTASMNVLYTCR
mmetsp:Transcript_26217/g.66723  ORF Transcript_26217/g.66723 Transcript_26217/m.66723 type:complete len:211 (+) Transcript_26217:995-1627(+)